MDPDRDWGIAERFIADGQIAKAREIYVRLLGHSVIAPYAHLRLSVMDHQAGSMRSAVSHALDALKKVRADPALLEMLCKLLLRLGETRAALACAEALQGMPAAASALAEVGKMLSDHMLPDAALPLLRRAMAEGMENLPAMQYLLGLNLIYTGDLSAAEQALEKSVRGNPGWAPAHWALAKIGNEVGRCERIRRLKALLGRGGSRGSDASLLWYSLFHELDRDGQIDDAWSALEKAMRIRRQQIRYDESAQEALFAEATQALRLVVNKPIDDAPAGPAPIFIVGLPRSGTTVIEQALCREADVVSAGELRDFTSQMRWVTERPGSLNVDANLLRTVQGDQLRLLGQRYLAHTRWRARGHGFYIDKWPENYLVIGHILASLPCARIICVLRNSADVCFSNLKEWFAAAYHYSYTQEEVARQFIRYEAFMRRVRDIGSPRMAFVEYEAFARKPQATIEALMRSHGIPRRTSQQPSSSIPTASAVQVRSSVNTRHIGSWARYEVWLKPMLDELGRGGFFQR